MWEESERDEKRKWIRRVRQEIIPQTLEEEKDYKIEELEWLDVEERRYKKKICWGRKRGRNGFRKKNRDTSLEYPHGVVVKHLENPPIKDGPPWGTLRTHFWEKSKMILILYIGRKITCYEIFETLEIWVTLTLHSLNIRWSFLL